MAAPEEKSPAAQEKAASEAFAEEPEEELPFVPEKAFPIHRGDRLVQDLEEIAVAEEEPAEEKEEKNRKIPSLLRKRSVRV